MAEKEERRQLEDRQPMRRLISVMEAAAYLNLSPKTIRNGLGPKAKKRFPVKPKRIGRRVSFDLKDLDEYIDNL